MQTPPPNSLAHAARQGVVGSIGGLGVAAAFAFSGTNAAASDAALQAFSANCFSPFMTATRAREVLPERHDFYDLRPFRTSNPVSPAVKRPVTPGTDRRCEVAFDGTRVDAGIATAAAALSREGITQEAVVPPSFQRAPGANFVAARQLNPSRVAVVQVGTRPGPRGVETFLNVERLEPSS